MDQEIPRKTPPVPFTGEAPDGQRIARFDSTKLENVEAKKMSILQLKALKKHLEDSIEKEKAFKVDQEDLLKIATKVDDIVSISAATTKIETHEEVIKKLTARLQEVTDELEKRERPWS